jgi:hypothetical protein
VEQAPEQHRELARGGNDRLAVPAASLDPLVEGAQRLVRTRSTSQSCRDAGRRSLIAERQARRPVALAARVAFEVVARRKIALDLGLRELGQRISEHAARESYDECMRDLNWEPMSDRQVVALARGIEKETGEQIVFERPVQ